MKTIETGGVMFDLDTLATPEGFLEVTKDVFYIEIGHLNIHPYCIQTKPHFKDEWRLCSNNALEAITFRNGCGKSRYFLLQKVR